MDSAGAAFVMTATLPDHDRYSRPSLTQWYSTPAACRVVLRGQDCADDAYAGRQGACVTATGATEGETPMPEGGRADRPLMIVDDDAAVRTISEFLQEYGLPGAAGRRWQIGTIDLLAKTPELRMIISDIRMPECPASNWRDLATERRNDLKIILISGYFVSQQVRRRFLRKPFRMSLEAAVRAELYP